MAKGQYLSGYQRGIVKRYYAHRDGILVRRLQELVSDLAMEPASDKLWARAEQTIAKLELDPPLREADVEASIGQRDVAKLAELMATIDRR